MASLAVPLMVAGGVTSMIGQGQAGREAYSRGLSQKAINEVAAGQAVAAGQRVAIEERRQAELTASRAVAVAAAGGAADDIDSLIADIDKEGEYRANVALYEAETEAERIKFQGELAARVGKDEYKASKVAQASTILQTGATIAALNTPKKSLAKTTKS